VRCCALACGCLNELRQEGCLLAGVVDPQADRPVYRQIADRLRAAIATGELQPGEQVPSEHELVAEYGVARGTARQAIMMLRNEGLIEAVHGLGCFVREPEPIERLRSDRLSQGWEIGHAPDDPPPDLHGPIGGPMGAPPEEFMMDFETRQLGKARAPADVAALLGLPAGAAVLLRRWETLYGDSVRAIAASYVPWAIATAVGLMDIQTGPAVYLAMADSDHRATRLLEEVAARMPTAAEAQRLNISDGVPVLSVQRVNYTADARPVEVTVTVMSADRYRLVYELGED
jgi:GntR family transcriptional regulator